MRSLGVALATLVFAAYAAQADIAEDLARCAKLASSEARLACYDRLNVPDDSATLGAAPVTTTEGDPTAAAPADQTSADPKGTAAELPEAQKPRMAVEGVPAAAAGADSGTQDQATASPIRLEEQTGLPQTSAAVDVAPDSSADTVSRRDAFGGQQFVHGKSESLTEITSVVAEVEKLSRGNFQLTMGDGQIWREVEYSRRTRYDVGDEVVIKRGFMGTYTLESKATGRHNKVMRIE